MPGPTLPSSPSRRAAWTLFFLSQRRAKEPVIPLQLYSSTLIGVGVGLMMQVLVLAIQNDFPVQDLGTATSANGFFQEIGAKLDTAAVGALFTHASPPSSPSGSPPPPRGPSATPSPSPRRWCARCRTGSRAL